MKILLILAALLAIVTLAILLVGVAGMARGGDFNKKYGNKLMRWRVIAQGATILLLFLLALAATA
ncbi:twin transmembrane helix small protein [Eilatimonas milleporae]|uniref:Hypoxia induced protein n=1 Tax=Eilatimonas milleporae TaxID=911205 RepID=A0A3M0C068_9PROT|nr:twin transmembrane helix small protein [Eilatimonas milleporae]RMB02692.1 hypoxia induced protein [Eilatimonas milleporae]